MPAVATYTPVPFQSFRAEPLHLAKCIFKVTDPWIDVVKSAFNPDQMMHFAPVGAAQIQEQSDLLVKILWARLQSHIRTRVEDESKQKSWVWNFARENLGRVAAMMILMQHVIDSLMGVVSRNDVCLLRSPYKNSKMVRLTADDGSRVPAALKLQGCYLHYNCEMGACI